VSPSADEPAAVTASAAAPAAGQATILVVDDEPAIRAVAARILRREGYAVLEAADGQEALLLASARDVSLLLTDTVMPRMSGTALADRLRQLKPALPVVYMSGYDTGILREEGIAADDQAFLAKPFTAEAILARVRAALGRPVPPGQAAGEGPTAGRCHGG
jgi:CheY-like chemotaxis protein